MCIVLAVNAAAREGLEQFNAGQSDLSLAVREPDGFPGLLVVALDGTLDTENATAFAEAVRKLLDVLVAPRVTAFDLQSLRYISSSGIGAFTNILVAVDAAGAHLMLYGLSANVRTVFETLGFTRFFHIINDWNEVTPYLIAPGS